MLNKIYNFSRLQMYVYKQSAYYAHTCIYKKCICVQCLVCKKFKEFVFKWDGLSISIIKHDYQGK